MSLAGVFIVAGVAVLVSGLEMSGSAASKVPLQVSGGIAILVGLVIAIVSLLVGRDEGSHASTSQSGIANVRGAVVAGDGNVVSVGPSNENTEQRVVNELLRWLEGRRVLWTPVVNEIPEEAVRSILTIRERVDNALGRVSKPEATEALRTIRNACITMLELPRGLAMFDQTSMDALEGFRRTVLSAAADLASSCGVDALEQLPHFAGGWEPGTEGEVRHIVPPRNAPGLASGDDEPAE